MNASEKSTLCILILIRVHKSMFKKNPKIKDGLPLTQYFQMFFFKVLNIFLHTVQVLMYCLMFKYH